MAKYYTYLFVAITLTAIVQAILKTISMKYDGSIFDSIYNPWLYFSLVLLVFALIAWFVSASKIEFSILIPVNVATIVIGGLIGYFIFGEEFGEKKILSYTLIISGVLLLIFSQQENILTNSNESDKNKLLTTKKQ
jgi:multidrug transporter EmrE-like cation transporter